MTIVAVSIILGGLLWRDGYNTRAAEPPAASSVTTVTSRTTPMPNCPDGYTLYATTINGTANIVGPNGKKTESDLIITTGMFDKTGIVGDIAVTSKLGRGDKPRVALARDQIYTLALSDDGDEAHWTVVQWVIPEPSSRVTIKGSNLAGNGVLMVCATLVP